MVPLIFLVLYLNLPTNVRTYGGKDKTCHNFGTKSLCTVSNIRLVYYLISYVLAPNLYLTVAPSVLKWSNTYTWTDRQTN